MIVGLVGLPGSGKGEAAKIFEDAGLRVFFMRSAVEEELKGNNIPVTAKNMTATGDRLRKEEGNGAIAKRLLPKIQNEPGNICIEGLRDVHEVRVFRESLEDYITIGIEAPPEKRYEWAMKRNREDDIKSYDEFLEKDKTEAGWGISEAMEEADYRISNDSDLPTFRNKIKELMEKILNRSEV